MSMTTQGIDYAWGHPNYSALPKDIKFAMRYISHDGGKDLTRTELKALNDHGVNVGVVYESTSGRALQGYAAGQADARYADERVKYLGLKGIPIFFAVDFDATDAQKPLIANYLKGCVSVLGKSRVGEYGSYYVVKYMILNSVTAWHWQTYAWSGGLVHPRAHLLQWRNGVTVAGVSADLNRGRDVVGWTRGPLSPPAPARYHVKQLKKLKRQLRLLRAVAKLLGWVPAVKRAANKRKALIKALSR